VKKPTNVTNARLTLEFNARGLPRVRVKPLKSRPINSGGKICGDRERGALCSAADRFGFDAPATLAAADDTTDVSIRADSTAQNALPRRAANTVIPPKLALNLAH
jgi:hypothetical protein